MVHSTKGSPIRANSKKPNGSRPCSPSASATITFTVLPLRVSSPPALAANATGINSCDGGWVSRRAVTSMIGTIAAAAPFGVTSAANSAARSMHAARSRERAEPSRSTSVRPAQAVTPEDSSPSESTNRAPTNSTIGSPKPASTVAGPITPATSNASGVAAATSSTGSRFQMNKAIAAPSTARVMTRSGMQAVSRIGARR